ncbi:U3 snoRNP protein [Xanthoria parietina]
MSRVTKDTEWSEAATFTQQEHPDLMDDDLSDAFSGFESDHEQNKDNIELELEKAVFGDKVGFHERLENHRTVEDGLDGSAAHRATVGKNVIGETQDNLRDIADADLFILDSGPSVKLPLPARPDDDANSDTDESGAAWHDSDDDRIVVSLQANPRLRNLRAYEDEDLVNGRQYTKRLRRQFELLNHVPLWVVQSRAKKSPVDNRSQNTKLLPDSDSSEGEMLVDADELSAPPLARILQQPGALLSSGTDISGGKRKLRPEVIDIQRTKDIGIAQPSAITSLEFHPSHPLIISSGPASTISMHHVSPHPPNPNPLLTSLHIRSTPLSTTVFQPRTGSRILFAGRRRYFHSWDLSTGRIDKISGLYGRQSEQKTMERFKMSPCGRWMGLVGSRRSGGGLINVLDARTFQWIAEVRVESNGGIADFDWWGDGEGMTVIGKGGEAVEWDGRQRRIVGRWVDEGAIGTTVIAMGGRGSGAKDLGGDRWVAVGSSSGVVNVYDRKTWGSGKVPPRPQPRRALDQLTTATSHLAFSPDGQLMVMASRLKRDALRLVHLPSCTVYRNWPTSSTPLGKITALAISPGSDLLAVANEQGKIRLWEIRA